jgi:hypothetical protein
VTEFSVFMPALKEADNLFIFAATGFSCPRCFVMPHNIPAFFESYANLYNRALVGENVFPEIATRFTPKFLGAGPDTVSIGQQGAAFRRTLEKTYRFYRQIGTRKMTAKRVEVTPIDAGHKMAKVFYCGDYRKPDGSELTIQFEVTYLLDVGHVKPKIFAVVSGDEMAMYRHHGLIPDGRTLAAKPRPKPRMPEHEKPERQRLH